MSKIAFLIGKVTNIGGIGRVVSLLSDSIITNSDHQIIVISYLQEKSSGYSWNESIRFHHLITKSKPLKSVIFRASMKLRKILKTENIDILISCGSLYGPPGVLATRFSNVKLIYWDHSNYFENTSHRFKIKSKNFTAYFADVVVPLTKADEANYRKHTSAKRIEQIYNPIDVKLENLTHDYNTNSRKIISVGRLKYQKNFLTLVDVAKLVLERVEGYEWHIYGSGPDEDDILQKIDALGLNGKLLLKGQSDDLYNLYKNYALMVMTSRYEGFPMTLLEGLANKLPMISFDIATGPNEIITDGENGYLIPPFDIKMMAERIIALLKDDQKRLEFANKNIEIMAAFSNKAITERWLNLFKDLQDKTKQT